MILDYVKSSCKSNASKLHIFSFSDFSEILQNIFNYKGSVNFYMFHGGTNFGFMNGANLLETTGIDAFPHYAPDVTSYGAPFFSDLLSFYDQFYDPCVQITTRPSPSPVTTRPSTTRPRR